MTARNCSAVDAIDDFAALARLFIKFGGDLPKALNRRLVWFNAQVNRVPAGTASPPLDVIKPTKDYFLHIAAMAGELEKLLIKHAEGHERT